MEGGRGSEDNDGPLSSGDSMSGSLPCPSFRAQLAESPPGPSADVSLSLHSIVPDIAVGTKVGVSCLTLHPALL